MTSLYKAVRMVSELALLLHKSNTLIIPSEQLKKDGVKFRKLIEKLGPTYVKFGQILSVRYDMLPAEICEELQYLLDHGKEIPFQKIKQRVEQSLCPKDFKLIKTIEPDPIGVASFGQVHKAYLTNGDTVAIKVQREGLRELLKNDLNAIKAFVRLVSIIPAVRRLRLGNFVDEFQFWTVRELDYMLEAENNLKFSKNFASDPTISTPKVYWRLCRKTILTTAFVDGVSIKYAIQKFKEVYPKESIKAGAMTINKTDMVQIMTKSAYQQIFVDGFAHGDPHPSNMILTGPKEITYIDFGIVAKLTAVQLQAFREFFQTVLLGEIDKAMTWLLMLDEEDGVVSKEKLRKEAIEVFSNVATSSAHEYSPTKGLMEMLYKGGNLGIQWPRYLVLFGKILAAYDGQIQAIHPEMNFIEQLKPYLQKSVLDSKLSKYNPQKMVKKALLTADDIVSMVQELPKEIKQLYEEVRREGIPIKIYNEDKAIEHGIQKYQFIIEIMVGVVLILVAATVVLSFSTQIVTLFSIPIISIMFALSGTVVILLLLVIFKSMKNEKTIRKAVLLGLGGYQYLKEEFEDFIKDLEKDGKITSEEGKKLVDEVMEDGKKLASKGTSEIRDVLQKIFNEVGIATSGDMDKLQEEVKKISKVSKII